MMKFLSYATATSVALVALQGCKSESGPDAMYKAVNAASTTVTKTGFDAKKVSDTYTTFKKAADKINKMKKEDKPKGDDLKKYKITEMEGDLDKMNAVFCTVDKENASKNMKQYTDKIVERYAWYTAKTYSCEPTPTPQPTEIQKLLAEAKNVVELLKIEMGKAAEDDKKKFQKQIDALNALNESSKVDDAKAAIKAARKLLPKDVQDLEKAQSQIDGLIKQLTALKMDDETKDLIANLTAAKTMDVIKLVKVQAAVQAAKDFIKANTPDADVAAMDKAYKAFVAGLTEDSDKALEAKRVKGSDQLAAYKAMKKDWEAVAANKGKTFDETAAVAEYTKVFEAYKQAQAQREADKNAMTAAYAEFEKSLTTPEMKATETERLVADVYEGKTSSEDQEAKKIAEYIKIREAWVAANVGPPPKTSADFTTAIAAVEYKTLYDAFEAEKELTKKANEAKTQFDLDLDLKDSAGDELIDADKTLLGHMWTAFGDNKQDKIDFMAEMEKVRKADAVVRVLNVDYPLIAADAANRANLVTQRLLVVYRAVAADQARKEVIAKMNKDYDAYVASLGNDEQEAETDRQTAVVDGAVDDAAVDKKLAVYTAIADHDTAAQPAIITAYKALLATFVVAKYDAQKALVVDFTPQETAAVAAYDFTAEDLATKCADYKAFKALTIADANPLKAWFLTKINAFVTREMTSKVDGLKIEAPVVAAAGLTELQITVEKARCAARTEVERLADWVAIKDLDNVAADYHLKTWFVDAINQFVEDWHHTALTTCLPAIDAPLQAVENDRWGNVAEADKYAEWNDNKDKTLVEDGATPSQMQVFLTGKITPLVDGALNIFTTQIALAAEQGVQVSDDAAAMRIVFDQMAPLDRINLMEQLRLVGQGDVAQVAGHAYVEATDGANAEAPERKLQIRNNLHEAYGFAFP